MVSSQALPHRARRLSASGFTLTEVALAIGIVAFAFVTLLALVPAGSTAFRRAIDISVAGQIAQRIINDAQMADFDALIDSANLNDQQGDLYTFRGPTIKEPALRYFDDQGREIVPESGPELSAKQKTKVIYEVNTRILPKAQLPSDLHAEKSGMVASKRPSQPLAQITIQIAHNPSGVKIPLSTASASSKDPQRNLWVPTEKQAGIELMTFSALIGRNQ